MTSCSPEAGKSGNIVRGRCPNAILPVDGERIVIPESERIVSLPSHKGKYCFIIPNFYFEF